MTGLDADIIVVGCGPVGVMFALRCAQRGLSVIAIDQATDVYPLPRAIGMDEEIQQLFAMAGIIDGLKLHSTPMRGAEFVDATGQRVVGLDIPEGEVGPLGYPRMVAGDQPGVECLLRTAAVDAGVDIRLGTAAVNIDDLQNDVGVRVELQSGSTSSALSSRWLVGADGARSTVRSLRGINLIDQGFDQTWLVVDTTLTDPELELPRIATQYCDPARICTFVPGHGTRRRWEFRLHPHETADAALETAFVADLLGRWGNPDQLVVDRAAVYRFHATVADRFRDGPVFLAGDAAHQMPPFNGQGMCTGMRDADNLAWKLSAVAKGHAGDGLLETYDAERRPHAAGEVAHAVDAGMLIEAIATKGEAALGSGYGQRPFPALKHGLIDGDHPAIGRPLRTAGLEGFGVDSVNEWTLIRTGEPPTVPSFWTEVGAKVFDVAIGDHPLLEADDHTIIVRPDTYVAAVTDDLESTTNKLSSIVLGS